MDLDSKCPVYSVLKTRGGFGVLFCCGLLCLLSRLGLSECESFCSDFVDEVKLIASGYEFLGE